MECNNDVVCFFKNRYVRFIRDRSGNKLKTNRATVGEITCKQEWS